MTRARLPVSMSAAMTKPHMRMLDCGTKYLLIASSRARPAAEYKNSQLGIIPLLVVPVELSVLLLLAEASQM